jgi:putative Mg2+ transporter-C (MgtC) family protein
MGQTHYDVTRVAAGIVTGIGFIGGGVIFKSADRVEGITTAAMIWMTTALGMACGFNDLPLAFCGLFFYLLILLISHFLHRIIGTHVKTPPPINTAPLKSASNAAAD